MSWFYRGRISRLESTVSILTRQVSKLMTDQEKLNAFATAINTAVTDLTAEVAALKNQPTNPPLDFSGLDSAVSGLANLDAANPPPAPTT